MPRRHSSHGIYSTSEAQAEAPEIGAMIERKEILRPFDVACARNDIDHRLTKLNYPWTNGQVETMNRTIKEGSLRGLAPLRAHLQNLD